MKKWCGCVFVVNGSMTFPGLIIWWLVIRRYHKRILSFRCSASGVLSHPRDEVSNGASTWSAWRSVFARNVDGTATPITDWTRVDTSDYRQCKWVGSGMTIVVITTGKLAAVLATQIEMLSNCDPLSRRNNSKSLKNIFFQNITNSYKSDDSCPCGCLHEIEPETTASGTESRKGGSLTVFRIGTKPKNFQVPRLRCFRVESPDRHTWKRKIKTCFSYSRHNVFLRCLQ